MQRRPKSSWCQAILLAFLLLTNVLSFGSSDALALAVTAQAVPAEATTDDAADESGTEIQTLEFQLMPQASAMFAAPAIGAVVPIWLISQSPLPASRIRAAQVQPTVFAYFRILTRYILSPQAP